MNTESISNITKLIDQGLSTQARILKRKPTLEAMNDLIVDSIQDIKGKNIVKLDLRRLGDGPADFFIICEGTSTTQVKAIADNIHKRLREEFGVSPNHIEGTKSALWVCIDYFNTVVHVFHPETRTFYELEDLWSDASVTQYDSL